MTDTQQTATSMAPEKYVRINITKNTKGYTYETTTSVRWQGAEDDGIQVIAGLLQHADATARVEIAQREAVDAGELGGE